MTTTDRQLTEREIKALQIAAKSKLTEKGIPGLSHLRQGMASMKLLMACLSRAAPVLITNSVKLRASMFTLCNT